MIKLLMDLGCLDRARVKASIELFISIRLNILGVVATFTARLTTLHRGTSSSRCGLCRSFTMNVGDGFFPFLELLLV